jgi:hypothetical protein
VDHVIRAEESKSDFLELCQSSEPTMFHMCTYLNISFLLHGLMDLP